MVLALRNMEPTLIAALLIPAENLSLEPEGAAIPYTFATQLKREIANHLTDLTFYEKDFAATNNVVKRRMRAFHIRRTKSYLLGLNELLNYLPIS
jgi:hypothetical protein